MKVCAIVELMMVFSFVFDLGGMTSPNPHFVVGRVQKEICKCCLISFVSVTFKLFLGNHLFNLEI